MALGTVRKSVNYSRNNPRSRPHSGHTNKIKPALTATKSAKRPSSSTVRRKRLTSWYPMMHLSQEKGKHQAKYTKSEKDAAFPAVDDTNYGIDLLNISKNAYDA